MNLDSNQFKKYRKELGFQSQEAAKEFLSAKDVVPAVDLPYLKSLCERLDEMYLQFNKVIHESVRHNKPSDLLKIGIQTPYRAIKADPLLLGKLNNQGRRPEQVLFNWLRGYATTQFLLPAIRYIFEINNKSILSIGQDDFSSLETFKRTPRADLLIMASGKKVRLEVQAGFQGINDVKQHKWIEAKKVFRNDNEQTICMHCDFYNGQVAFIKLSAITETDPKWITRQQMEGQTVFNIDQNMFLWGLMDKPQLWKKLKHLC